MGFHKNSWVQQCSILNTLKNYEKAEQSRIQPNLHSKNLLLEHVRAWAAIVIWLKRTRALLRDTVMRLGHMPGYYMYQLYVLGCLREKYFTLPVDDMNSPSYNKFTGGYGFLSASHTNSWQSTLILKNFNFQTLS